METSHAGGLMNIGPVWGVLFLAALFACGDPTGSEHPKPKPPPLTVSANVSVRGGDAELTLNPSKAATFTLSYGKGTECSTPSDARTLSRLALATSYRWCYTATAGSETVSGHVNFATEDPCVADLSRFEHTDINFRHRPDTARFFVTLAPVQYALVCGDSYKVFSHSNTIIESVDGGVTYARTFSVPIGATIGVQYRRTVGGNNSDGGWLTGKEMYFFPKGDSSIVTRSVTKTPTPIPNGCVPPNPCSQDGLWLLKAEAAQQGIVISAP
jgi:hypothetical protein